MKPADRRSSASPANGTATGEGAYNRAASMPRRRELAGIWADMLSERLPEPAILVERPSKPVASVRGAGHEIRSRSTSGSLCGAGKHDLSARTFAVAHASADRAKDMLNLEMDVARHLVMGLDAVKERCDRDGREGHDVIGQALRLDRFRLALLNPPAVARRLFIPSLILSCRWRSKSASTNFCWTMPAATPPSPERGGPMHLDMFEDLHHVFQISSGVLPSADKALDDAAAFVSRHWWPMALPLFLRG